MRARAYLKGLVLRDHDREAREAAPPRAPDAQEQHVAVVLPQDAADAHDVLHGVHEEDEGHHGGVLAVVAVQVVFEDQAEAVHVRDLGVLLLVGAGVHEVAVQQPRGTEYLMGGGGQRCVGRGRDGRGRIRGRFRTARAQRQLLR